MSLHPSKRITAATSDRVFHIRNIDGFSQFMSSSSQISSAGTYVLSGETLTIDAGATQDGVTVTGGGQLVVSGTASGTTLMGVWGQSATEIVASGGTEENVTISSGSLQVSSGGFLGAATVQSEGFVTLSAGASTHSVSVGSGTQITVSAATLDSLTLSGGIAAFTSAAVPLSSFSSATLLLNDGAHTDGLTAGPGALLQVTRTSISGTVVSGSGAQENIYSPAEDGSPADTQFVIRDGGTQTVWSGATVTSGCVATGGSQTLLSGSIASAMNIASGGLQTISSGATAVQPVIEAGASVVNDGVMTFTGAAVVQGHLSGSGSIMQTGAHDTLCFGSGALTDYSGSLNIGAGTVEISEGTEASHVQIAFGSDTQGTLILGQPAPSSLQISDFTAGDKIVLSGIESGTVTNLVSGSTLQIESGGKVLETISLGSGLDYSGAGLSLTEQSDGHTAVLTLTGATSGYVDQTIPAGATQVVVSSGEGAVIAAGTTAVATSVAGGGRLYVDGTGLQDHVTGTETVRSDGRVYQTTVFRDGEETVLTSGQAFATTVSGGTQLVDGGTASGTMIAGGAVSETGSASAAGVQIVRDGGVVTDTTLTVGSGMENWLYLTEYSDSWQYVENGGTAVGTVLSGAHCAQHYHMNLMWGDGYAHEVVSAGGSATQTTIRNNGVMDVLSGGSASDVLLDGGTLILDAGASYSGTLTFASRLSDMDNLIPGGWLQGLYPTPSVLQASVATLSHLTINGFNGPARSIRSQEANGSFTVSTINTIEITDLKFAGSADQVQSAQISPDGSLLVTEGSESLTLHFGGTFASPLYFQAAPDGGTEIVYGVPCYCPGALITTETGDRPVETLEPGDLILTASGAYCPVRWLGRRSYDGRFARGNPDIMPVRFLAGSLGNGLPRRDLTVSPLHAMVVDSVLIPARLLVNGRSIVQIQTADQIDYIHVELDSHDVLFAEGTPSETFVDDGSRGMFHNAEEFAELYPDAAEPVSSGEYGLFCLPRLEDGPYLEAIRARLAALATANPDYSPVTGFVDVAGPAVVEGWARHETAPDVPCELIIRADGQEIGRVTAQHYRRDLSGCFGFFFALPEEAADAEITVDDSRSGTMLPFAADSGPTASAA